MKTVIFILLILCLNIARLTQAADPVNETLQKGLYEEEANHNLDAAIKAYQSVIARHDDQRKLAATAVFRLGECYRKLGRTNEATTQYQRILDEFVDQAALANLSRQNLAGLGAPGSTTDKSVEVAGATDEEEKEVKRIKALIKDSPDLINSPGEGGLTPLHKAANAGQLVVARFLLANRADINAKDKATGATPLHAAAERGHKTMTELLIASGADLNAMRNEGTPLHGAAVNGFRTVVEVLLANKANVNASSSEGRTPLHAAAEGGYKPIAELLLANGADLNAKGSSDQTPLHLAASKGHLPVIDLLLARKADVNAGGKNGSPVVAAVANGHLKVTEALLDHGADVNAKSPGGDSLLHIAARSKASEMLKLILARKPDLEIRDGEGLSPLQRAVLYKLNNIVQAGDAVQLLVAAGADVNARFNPVGLGARSRLNASTGHTDIAGRAPLSAAAFKGSVELVNALLAGGADVNATSWEDKTSLHYAVENQSLPLVTAILARHPDTEIRDDKGYTPLLRAVAGREAKIVEALLQGGANVNTTLAPYGLSALHFAVSNRRKDLVELLLTNKANVNMINREGDTPLALAQRRSGNPSEQAILDEIAPLLLKHGADENIRRRSFILVSRAERNLSETVFFKGTKDYNRHTLLELVAGLYAKTDSGRGGEYPFPDFANVKIKRPSPMTGGPVSIAAISDVISSKENADRSLDISVNLETVFKSGDCSKDVPLEWGDIVEIPELDHRANEQWPGLSKELRDTMIKCLKRTIQITVKGETNKVLLVPDFKPAIASSTQAPGSLAARIKAARLTPAEESWKTQRSFRLVPVLLGANVIRVSSDLTQVKVKRVDPATGQSREMLFDLSDKQPHDDRTDLWLRDGDVIEVPEK